MGRVAANEPRGRKRVERLLFESVLLILVCVEGPLPQTLQCPQAAAGHLRGQRRLVDSGALLLHTLRALSHLILAPSYPIPVPRTDVGVTRVPVGVAGPGASLVETGLGGGQSGLGVTERLTGRAEHALRRLVLGLAPVEHGLKTEFETGQAHSAFSAARLSSRVTRASADWRRNPLMASLRLSAASIRGLVPAT